MLRCCIVKDMTALSCVGVLKLLVVSWWDEGRIIEQIDRVYLQYGIEVKCSATVAYRSRGCVYLFSPAKTNGLWMFAYAQAWQAGGGGRASAGAARFETGRMKAGSNELL